MVRDGFNLKEIKDVFQSSEDEKNSLLQQQINQALNLIEGFSFSSLSTDDKPITFYVAGYIARQLIKKTKCQDCQALFRKNWETLAVKIDVNGATEHDTKAGEEFIDAIARGGLIKPSDLLSIVAALANDLWKYIKSVSQIRKFFLSSVNARSVFTKVFIEKLDESSATDCIANTTCKSGHKFTHFVQMISNAMFNIFAKNTVSEANSKIHQTRKRDKSKDDGDDAQKRDPILVRKQKLKSL